MPTEKSHSSEQITAFLNEIKTQTDRGAAIIAAAVLDDILELLLLARLVELSSARREALLGRTGAPLSSFSAKIEMAFALGIMTNGIRLALHLVRDIRNKFAHSMKQITFDHPEVADMLQARVFPEIKKQGRSNRDLYSDLFSTVAIILYGTLAANIRIMSLEETHKAHFVTMAFQMAEVVKGAASEQPPKAPSSDPTEQQ